jgi:dipeptidyl aminopeptidase/acylaminoacyl peptidase
MGSQVQQLTNDAAGDFVPDWSPDGGRIAFAKGRKRQSDVYVLNNDGSALRQLTDDTASAGAPAWSPDGNAMVFASDRDGDYDIYTIYADGSTLEKLTDLPDDEGRQEHGTPDGLGSELLQSLLRERSDQVLAGIRPQPLADDWVEVGSCAPRGFRCLRLLLWTRPRVRGVGPAASGCQ